MKKCTGIYSRFVRNDTITDAKIVQTVCGRAISRGRIYHGPVAGQ
jgi:hypothetical protein